MRSTLANLLTRIAVAGLACRALDVVAMNMWLQGFCKAGLPVMLCGLFLTVCATEPFARLRQIAAEQFGQATAGRIHFWTNLVTKYDNAETIEKLHAANQFFNVQIRFTTDQVAWGEEDFWATPLESLHKQQGDCEDFSLAKYISLLLMGINEEQLRLVYVQAQVGPDPKKDIQAHMVVAYYPSPGAEPLILDNLISEIRLASQRTDLVPVFSFDAKNMWVQGQANSYANSQSRLSKWQDALSRIRNQGFFDETP